MGTRENSLLQQRYKPPTITSCEEMEKHCSNEVDAISLEPWCSASHKADYFVGPGDHMNDKQCFYLETLIRHIEARLSSGFAPTNPITNQPVPMDTLLVLCARFVRAGGIMSGPLWEYLTPALYPNGVAEASAPLTGTPAEQRAALLELINDENRSFTTRSAITITPTRGYVSGVRFAQEPTTLGSLIRQFRSNMIHPQRAASILYDITSEADRSRLLS